MNLALGVLLAAASVFAGRLKRASVVPAAACALEFLLILAAGIVPGAFVSMMHVPLETTDVVVRCLRMTDLGMLIGMVLVIAAGMLAAKRRLLLPVLVMAGAAVLSAAACDHIIPKFFDKFQSADSCSGHVAAYLWA